MRERDLKKRIRQLKKQRTAVIVGDVTGITEEQINAEIEAIREELGIAEEREEIIRTEFKAHEYLEYFCTQEEFEQMAASGCTLTEIARKWGVEPQTLKKWSKGDVEMTRTAKLTVGFFKEKMAQGVTIEQLSNDLGLKLSTIKQYERGWKKQGLLDDMGEKKKEVVEKKKEVVAEAKAIVAEPVAKTEQKEDDASYKMLAQQYRDDLEKMGAELAREKEQTKIAVTELHEVQRQRIQLHNEIAELAEELANASYEYAELKRDFNALVMIAKPLVAQYAEALAVKE